MTDRFDEQARKMCPCTCTWPREPGMCWSFKPESIEGPMKDGSHFSGCESENREDFAQALRDTWNDAIEAARAAHLQALTDSGIPMDKLISGEYVAVPKRAWEAKSAITRQAMLTAHKE